MKKEMITNIISIVVVNIIAILFIVFTIFARFGIHIEVIKKVDCVPVSVSYSNSERVVLVEPDDDDIDRFWVDAGDIFGTDKERELREMIEDEDSVRLNVFINPKTDEVLGVTKKGTSVLALIYNNHKLFRYGIVFIPCVDLFIILVILLSNKRISKKEIDNKLKNYEYHPSNPKKLRLKEILHKMRDLRLLYILSSPLWLIMLALTITCISTWVCDEMNTARTGEDGSSRWVFTGITIGVYLAVFFIYYMINFILKNRNIRPQILQNIRAYLPGTPENIFDDVERDLAKGMPFLKNHNLGISENYVIGNLNLTTFNPVIIPKSEVVEVVYEIFEGRSLTIAHNGRLTNARQFYQNFFFRLRNGNYIPVQVNDKFMLWAAISALQKVGFKTVELNRDDIKNALRSRKNSNTYVMENERIAVRKDDSTYLIPLLQSSGYVRFDALFYDPANKLNVIISCADGSKDQFVIDEDSLMLTEGRKLPGQAKETSPAAAPAASPASSPAETTVTSSDASAVAFKNEDMSKPVSSESQALSRDVFFELIMNVCDWDKSGDDDQVLAPLVDHLSKQSDEYIFAFEDIMSELLYEIDTRKNYEKAAGIISKNSDLYLSDDLFLYSRCVAIINGKDYYNKVKNGKITDLWNSEFEAILYVARDAWARKHGKSASEFPHISPVSYETGSNKAGWENEYMFRDKKTLSEKGLLVTSEMEGVSDFIWSLGLRSVSADKEELKKWLSDPVPYLNDKTPVETLKSPNGEEKVWDLMGKIKGGDL